MSDPRTLSFDLRDPAYRETLGATRSEQPVPGVGDDPAGSEYFDDGWSVPIVDGMIGKFDVQDYIRLVTEDPEVTAEAIIGGVRFYRAGRRPWSPVKVTA